MKRILLKLSGEALAGAEKKGFDEATVIAVAKQIRAVAEEGTQIGIVSVEATSGEAVQARRSIVTKQIRSVCLPL